MPIPDMMTEAREELEDSQQSSQQFLARAYFSSGPLPSPDLLAKYQQIIPNAPERFMNLLESETAHRQAEEKRQLTGYLRSVFSAQLFGFIIALCGFAAAMYAMLAGRPWEFVAIFLSPAVLGVVSKLIQNNKE